MLVCVSFFRLMLEGKIREGWKALEIFNDLSYNCEAGRRDATAKSVWNLN